MYMYINFIWSLSSLIFLLNIGIVSVAHTYCPCDPGKNICNESVQRFSVSLTLNLRLAMLKPWPISRLLCKDPMFVGKLYCTFSYTNCNITDSERLRCFVLRQRKNPKSIRRQQPQLMDGLLILNLVIELSWNSKGRSIARVALHQCTSAHVAEVRGSF